MCNRDQMDKCNSMWKKNRLYCWNGWHFDHYWTSVHFCASHNKSKDAFSPPRSINSNIPYLYKSGNHYVDLSVLYYYYAYHLSDICIAGKPVSFIFRQIKTWIDWIEIKTNVNVPASSKMTFLIHIIRFSCFMQPLLSIMLFFCWGLVGL